MQYVPKLRTLLDKSFRFSVAGQSAFTDVEFDEVTRGLFDVLEKAEDVVWYDDVPSVSKVSRRAQSGIKERLILENMIVFPNLGRPSDVKFACKGLKYAWKKFKDSERVNMR